MMRTGATAGFGCRPGRCAAGLACLLSVRCRQARAAVGLRVVLAVQLRAVEDQRQAASLHAALGLAFILQDTLGLQMRRLAAGRGWLRCPARRRPRRAPRSSPPELSPWPPFWLRLRRSPWITVYCCEPGPPPPLLHAAGCARGRKGAQAVLPQVTSSLQRLSNVCSPA